MVTETPVPTVTTEHINFGFVAGGSVGGAIIIFVIGVAFYVVKKRTQGKYVVNALS